MEAVSFAGRPGERGMTMEQKRKSVLRAAGTVLLVGCALVAWGATIRRDMSEERSKAALSSLLQRAALGASGGSNSSSTPLSGTDFSRMMEEYDHASEKELEKAGLSRGSSSPSDCTLTSSKGCMEENDRSFNALRFMIWKRQHDPAEKSDPTDQWANQAVEIAEKIAKHASSKATQERFELDAALKDLTGKKKQATTSAMQKMFVAQTAKQNALVASLQAEIAQQKAELKEKEVPKLQLFELKTAKELRKVDADQRSKDAIAKSREIQAQKAAMARMEKRAKAREENLEDQISILKVNDAVEVKKETQLREADKGDAAKVREEKAELEKAEATFRRQLVLEVSGGQSLASAGVSAPAKQEPEAKAKAAAAKPAAAAAVAKAGAGAKGAKKAVAASAAAAAPATAKKAAKKVPAAAASAAAAKKAPAASLSSVHLDDASF